MTNKYDKTFSKEFSVPSISNELVTWPALAMAMDTTKKITFMVADAENTGKLGSAFDIILIMNVIVEERKKRNMHKLFSAAHKLLTKQGILLVLDTHPMAPNVQPNFKLPTGYSYFKSGMVVGVEVKKVDGKIIRYHDSHYTLQDLSEFFSQNGFLIKRIAEARASMATLRKHAEVVNRLKYPGDIIIEGIKTR